VSESINDEIVSSINQLAKTLIQQNKTVAVAESCTGGWLSKVLTDLPGSSHWFLGGVVSYSNEAKQHFLNVNKGDIDQYGAVSQSVAEQMVKGVEAGFKSSISLSVTGVAGPSGGTVDKPVGLVWFAVKATDMPVSSVMKNFIGDREQVRQKAVLTALTLLIDQLTT
jgi:nicotinamide-nucleotide amidase